VNAVATSLSEALLNAATGYAQRGWPVFPAKSKRPLLKHGLLEASTDPTVVQRWWGDGLFPEAQIGVRTGAISGLLVLDVDGDDGADSLHDAERSYSALPRTATVRTPGGGAHYYLAHPGGEIRNSAGRLGTGLDIRGDGGYVIAPPSVDAEGRRYEPDDRAPLAPCPPWLLALIAGGSNGQRQATNPSVWLSIVRGGLPEGQRNDGTARFVGHLLRRYVDPELVAELAHLVNARNRPPLDGEEVDRIVASVLDREMRRRGMAA